MKRKRGTVDSTSVHDASDSDSQAASRSPSPVGSTEDDDEIIGPHKRARTAKDKSKSRSDPVKRSYQKPGLEAEDDIPEIEQNDEGEGGSEDDELVDSEFEESDDGGGDDYNAENYFDAGEDDDYDDGGGADDGAYE